MGEGGDILKIRFWKNATITILKSKGVRRIESMKLKFMPTFIYLWGSITV